ncbi:MAG: hypothetical protein LLG00_14200 [Planctomycetaceae bacterium]|nr:hypothetical protein [Planctomycetaceae bacterium]
MSVPPSNRLLELLTNIQPMLAMFWLGLALFSAGLAVLLYTRWGQYKPLRKCMALSLLAHLLLATYATTVQIVTPTPPAPAVVQLALCDVPGDASRGAGGQPASTADPHDQPWESLPGDTPPRPEKAKSEDKLKTGPSEPKRSAHADDPRLPIDKPLRDVALPEAKPLAPKLAAKPATPTPPPPAIAPPPAQRRETATVMPPAPSESHDRAEDDLAAKRVRPSSDDVPLALLKPPEALPKISDSDDANAPDWRSAPRVVADSRQSVLTMKPSERAADASSRSADRPESTSAAALPVGLATPSTSNKPLPDAYRLRVAPNRAGVAQSHGGSVETEAAVKAALKWLADNQAADGRWDPRSHDAGKETNALGRTRPGAGSHADTAVTGLSLLAFLASGHTHLDGPYREDVRRAVEYLMRVQAADGNLAGEAVNYEFMYCHGIATCALSEAYGMTHDGRLHDPLRRAIAYTLAAQDPIGGGWRYRPRDSGDTSQLGWQLMALKSAELAGIPIPDATRQGVVRYLRSVSSGQSGGRASYRPGEQATRSMSAEALVCWQFLGLPRHHPACDEAGDFILGELPSEGQSNVYYWYYATLAMYQLQGVHWQRWNESLRSTVVNRQVKSGPLAGSWNTDDLWGGYGGRVYTTALSTLILEVYYRFLPIYGATPPGGSH